MAIDLQFSFPRRNFLEKNSLLLPRHTLLAHLVYGIGEPYSDLMNNYGVLFGEEKPVRLNNKRRKEDKPGKNGEGI